MKEEVLIQEIKTLKKAAKIHTKYSIIQYKKVLKLLEEIEKEKKSLEKKVKDRTIHLEKQIKENEKLTQKLKELANFDYLTRLLNRRAFLQRLNSLANDEFSVMFLDLDGFKQVNDIYGHKIGDELLKIVSVRIINTLRKEDIVARIGGDEFVILVKGKKSKKELEIIANKLIEKISSPILIDNIKVKVGTSIGIYIYNKKDPLGKILSFADSAMYKAKKSGKGKFVFFNPLLNNVYIHKKIKEALKNGNLIKKFYPILLNNELFAKELIIELEDLTFKEILDALGEDKTLLQEFTLFILKNINEKTLIHIHYKMLNKDFLEKIKNLNLIPSQICLAIESSYLKYIKEEILEEFSNAGFKIVLNRYEDTCFALSYLGLPFDAVKIDKNSIEKRLFDGFRNILKSLNIKLIIKSSSCYYIKN